MGARGIGDFEERGEFLLSRLTWPSGLVRERAAASIAELLLGQDAATITNALLSWTQRQSLESEAALGLIPFCRARRSDPSIQIPGDELKHAVTPSSLLSHLFLEELGLVEDSPPEFQRLHSETAPDSFRPRPFFGEHVRGFLPPVYAIRAESIERQAGLQFTKQWAFEWELLLRNEGVAPSTSAAHYWGRKEDWHYVAFDLKLSEVYRSAYLRALAWAVTIGGLSFQAATFRAAQTSPVDLALWGIEPGRRPNWWPSPGEPAGKIDTVPAQVWQEVARLWKSQQAITESEILLAAGGRVYEREVVYDLQILAVLQATRGPARGDPKELFEACNDVTFRHSSLPLRFEGTLTPIAPNDVMAFSGDWGVLPLSGQVRPTSSNRWQYWRHYRGIRLPVPFLSDTKISFRCAAHAIEVSDGHGGSARWSDWTDGLTERLLANLPPRTGYVLTADAELVRSFAERTDLTFAWLCRLTVYHRRHGFGEFEEFSDHRDFGTTGLIVAR